MAAEAVSRGSYLECWQIPAGDHAAAGAEADLGAARADGVEVAADLEDLAAGRAEAEGLPEVGEAKLKKLSRSTNFKHSKSPKRRQPFVAQGKRGCRK